MFTEELEKIIEQHGEAAREHEKNAIQIGDYYIIQDFGLDAKNQNTLDSLIASRRNNTHGVVDIRFFKKPDDFILFDSDEETVEIEMIDLCKMFGKFYPDDYYHSSLPEWWTDGDMRNTAEVMEPMDFGIWIQDEFRPSESEEEILDVWLESLQPFLGEELVFYKMEDDNNENCGFAQYIFDGDSCIVLVVKCWVL
jgi:hypothetical protein